MKAISVVAVDTPEITVEFQIWRLPQSVLIVVPIPAAFEIVEWRGRIVWNGPNILESRHNDLSRIVVISPEMKGGIERMSPPPLSS